MILSDKTILALMSAGQLGIEPVTPEQIQPASVDIRLGNTFSYFSSDNPDVPLSMSSQPTYTTVTCDRFVVAPKQFVLATTMEYFRLPDNLTAFVEGRSSIGRLGLFIQNAGWVDPGFEGEITLELFNASDRAIELEAGRRVGQLVFAQLDWDALNPYRGKYQGQKGTTGSRIYLDAETGSL
ncbi:dCTP deaminase [Angelakisella massiliensis]|uniref:dCTP deaminase n=1 Tax=Angelakisella massiliensis TaxID=1871018 RepID=UPI0024B1B3AD|nr:dCTP deaminase [Angelakisella massiliensis]